MDVLSGTTDVTTYVKLRLAADSTEATGLTPADFDLQFVRNRESPSAKVDATACAAVNAAHADNTVIEVDATDQPGLYRVDWPDAAFAPGVSQVILTVKVATAFTEEIRVNLQPVPADVRRWRGEDVPEPHTPGVPETDLVSWQGDFVAEANEDGFLPVDLAQIGGLDVEAEGGLLKCNVVQIHDDESAAANAERYFDGTGYGNLLVRTTIAVLTSQTVFVLTSGAPDSDAYNGCLAVIEDAQTSAQKAVGIVLDYVGSSRTVTLLADPGVFTIGNGDTVTILAGSVLSAAACNRLADFARRRTQANVETSPSSDADSAALASLYGLIQQAQKSDASASPGVLTVYQTDGTTSLGTKTLSSDASAAPVVRVQ